MSCELALWLTKDLGKQVVLVEALDKLMAVNALSRKICWSAIPWDSGAVPFNRLNAVLLPDYKQSNHNKKVGEVNYYRRVLYGPKSLPPRYKNTGKPY